MSPGHKLTKKDIDGMVILYEGGWSLRFIGEQYNVAYSTVHRHLTKRGVELRSRNIHEGPSTGDHHKHAEMERTIFMYRHQHLSMQEIADIQHVRVGTVRRRLQYAGVIPRAGKRSTVNYHKRNPYSKVAA